jgi:hypothetical protein
VHISVAGGPVVPVQLDTGSSGLVISSAAVGPSATPTGDTVPIPYLSGTVTGSLTRGSVSIGGLATSSSTGFVEASASSGSMVKLRQDNGVDGILGIGMAGDDVADTSWYSPLLQLPAPYWRGVTVHVATSGTGSLVIGPVSPAAGDTSLPMIPAEGLSTYPGGVPAFQKDATMCWTAGSASAVCGTTDMDLGVPNPILDPAGVPDAPLVDSVVVRPGTAMNVSTPGGTSLWSFTAADVRSPTLVELESQGYTMFNAGIGFFFAHTVAYDVSAGQFLISGPSS